jgi:hypothetical protein
MASESARKAQIEFSIEEMIHHTSPEVMKLAAQHPGLTEELALSFLTRRDLAPVAIEALSKRGDLLKHRKVSVAIAGHAKTPRHVALPIVRRLFTFELMQLALSPAVTADIKLVAEEVIVGRLESISSGERLTLAKQASSRVAAALLFDSEPRVVEASLMNSRLTESGIVRALMRPEAGVLLIDLACKHPKWSLRREIQIALLRNPNTPFGRILQIAPLLPMRTLRDVLKTSKVAPEVQSYLERMLETRRGPNHADLQK